MPDLESKFIVIALTAFLPEYKGLKIIPEHAATLEIYSKVFGPASHQECEDWVAANGGGLFRVIALTASLPSYQGCKVIPYEVLYPAIYSSAYGPETFSDCKAWVAENCGK